MTSPAPADRSPSPDEHDQCHACRRRRASVAGLAEGHAGSHLWGVGRGHIKGVFNESAKKINWNHPALWLSSPNWLAFF